jgi:hypothetical protein
VANNLPKLNIPVTVQTDGVDRGLSAVERKIRNSAAKMKRLGGTAQAPSAGGLGGSMGAGKATAFLGGVGKLGPASGLLGGMGGAGLALAAGPAVISGMLQSMERLAALTKGAGEAMKEFQQTGEQTFALNSGILARLAESEKGAQNFAKTMGFFEAMSFGGARPGETSGGEFWGGQLARGGAALGGILAGKSVKENLLLAELATASEPRSKEIAGELKQAEATRFDKGLIEGLATGESVMWSLEKMAINMMRAWDG